MKRTILLILVTAALGAASALAAGPDITLTPSALDIGTAYNGATLTVSGTVPEGAQVVVRFIGEPGDLTMKQKGKALGLLWMNLGSLHFTKVPSVCLVASSAPLAKLGQAGAGLGLAGAAGSIGLAPDSPDRAMLAAELVRLKIGEGLFNESAGTVSLGAAGPDGAAFTATLAIPSRLAPGTYKVEAVAVKDGAVAARFEKPFAVALAGIPAKLADLAFNHGAWYGVLASVVAILAGLAIGMVFTSKEAH